MNLVIVSIGFILGTIGLERIITKSKVFRPIREWVTTKNLFIGYMLSCSQCIGFWSAFLVYLLFYAKLYFVVYMLIGSFVCDIADNLIKKLK